MEQKIPYRRVLSIAIVFILSGLQVMNAFVRERQNLWLITLIIAVGVIPLLLIFARLNALNPGKNFFEIVFSSCGKVFGYIISALYIYYALKLSGVTFRYLTEFIQMVSMPETSKLVTLAFFAFLCFYILQSGLDVMSRFCSIVLPAVIIIQIIIITFSVGIYDFSYLRPIDPEQYVPMLTSSFKLCAFSFGETVFLIGIVACTDFSKKRITPDKNRLNKQKKPSSPFSVYLWALLVGALTISAVMLSNLLVLGHGSMFKLYFPYYDAVSLIKIGDFITRIEVISVISYILTVVVKVSVCIYCATTGFCYMFKMRSSKVLTFIFVAAAAIFSMFVFKDAVDMFERDGYPIYESYVFQLAIPLVVWLKCEIDRILNKRKPLQDKGMVS